MSAPGHELRTLATAQHRVEADMLQGMLRAEGIESMVRRAGTFGVPQFGDAAPHEVLVNESDYDRAHELVHRGEIQVHLPGSRSGPEPGNLLAAILIVLGLIALAVWLSGQF